jgi:hypothetical protein
MKLVYNIKDQGWGNQKSKIIIALIDPSKDYNLDDNVD